MELEELNEDEFDRFQKFIYRTSGIRVPASKRKLLSSRIRRRLRGGEFQSYRDYFQHITTTAGREELDRFLDAVTTQETFFFRTQRHFEWFAGEFLPQLILEGLQDRRPKSLRIWSAAASTGEEAYTLAMCVAECQLRLRDWRIQIVGTDISPDAVARANEGVYNGRSVAGISDKRLRRFMNPHDEARWQVRPVLRDLVEFRVHNLIESWREDPFDCVFLRNVLIYFDRGSRQSVVKHVIEAMAEESWLVVGPSEGVFDMLGSLRKHSTFLYQKTSRLS